MRPTIIVFALTAILSCSAEPPVEQLADSYVDLLRFRDRTTRTDTTRIRAGIDSVLEVHGLTPNSYRAGLAALADEPSRLSAFFARVDERLAATNPALAPAP